VAPTCPYDAKRLYLERFAGHDGWPVSVITADVSEAGRLAALREGPYGRCVYGGGNDVPDHQTVALTFANGVSATLEVNAFHAIGTRRVTITGSHAELRADLKADLLEVIDLRSDAVTRIDLPPGDREGHAGGDAALMDDLTRRVAAWKAGDRTPSPTSLRQALTSHRWAFAAEAARRSGAVVQLDEAGRMVGSAGA
jgi:predicted dehydrogenase